MQDEQRIALRHLCSGMTKKQAGMMTFRKHTAQCCRSAARVSVVEGCDAAHPVDPRVCQRAAQRPDRKHGDPALRWYLYTHLAVTRRCAQTLCSQSAMQAADPHICGLIATAPFGREHGNACWCAPQSGPDGPAAWLYRPPRASAARMPRRQHHPSAALGAGTPEGTCLAAAGVLLSTGSEDNG